MSDTSLHNIIYRLSEDFNSKLTISPSVLSISDETESTIPNVSKTKQENLSFPNFSQSEERTLSNTPSLYPPLDDNNIFTPKSSFQPYSEPCLALLTPVKQEKPNIPNQNSPIPKSDDSDSDYSPCSSSDELEYPFIPEVKIKTYNVNTKDHNLQAEQILRKHGLEHSIKKILNGVSKCDTEGYIYAYYTATKPGIFKVGRSKNLPQRRIRMQEINNAEKYFNKESFHVCFHHLVEACVHLELKDVRIKLEKKQDGYTEWFKVDWARLRRTIVSVKDGIMELLFKNLLLFDIAC
jgi:hypothetical protein